MPSDVEARGPGCPRVYAWRRGLVTLLLLSGVTLAILKAHGHEIPAFDDIYLQGVFAPSFTPPAAGTYELPIIKRVPGFVLIDAAGRRVNTRAVTQGKVAVVSFIYTACSDRLGCPLASVALRELQAKLLQEDLQQDAVLLSISLDPERDTPAHLEKYARRFGADPSVWRWLTASSERAIRPVLEGYGQDRARVYDGHGRFIGRYRHVLKVFLVDREGQIRNIYSTGFLVPQVVVNDVKTLLAAENRKEY